MVPCKSSSRHRIFLCQYRPLHTSRYLAMELMWLPGFRIFVTPPSLRASLCSRPCVSPSAGLTLLISRSKSEARLELNLTFDPVICFDFKRIGSLQALSLLFNLLDNSEDRNSTSKIRSSETCLGQLDMLSIAEVQVQTQPFQTMPETLLTEDYQVAGVRKRPQMHADVFLGMVTELRKASWEYLHYDMMKHNYNKTIHWDYQRRLSNAFDNDRFNIKVKTCVSESIHCC